MQTIQYLTVLAEQAGQRLDNYLVSRLKGLPKSRLYRIIRKGELRVNKKRVKVDYRLQENDIIRIPPLRLAAPAEKPVLHKRFAENLKASILFENKDFLVLDKPSGIAVHGGSGIQLGIIEALRTLYPQQKYLELVHRLDRETSGCLLIAKKSSILKELHHLLREGQMTKTYTALVCGHWPKLKKKIDAPLLKNQLKSGERLVFVDPRGKASLTKFRPIRYFSKVTLIEALPVSGRTHQIRVHTQYAGHPIIGDEKYGDKTMNKVIQNLGCSRLFLHASRLSFTLSSTKQFFDFHAPLPTALADCLTQLDPSS